MSRATSCGFCKGTGRDPNIVLADRNCPVCNGAKRLSTDSVQFYDVYYDVRVLKNDPKSFGGFDTLEELEEWRRQA
jgi:hypothetical protein